MIAEFMGMKVHCEQVYSMKECSWSKCPPNLHWPFESAPPFNENWAWLMPVVENICRREYDDGDNAYFRTFGMVRNEGKTVMVRINRHILCESDTLIEATYLAVLDFIKFFNENP